MKLADIQSNKITGSVKVRCPECHEDRSNKHDKSLSVDLDRGVYNCHYCGAKGILDEYKDQPPILPDPKYSQPKLNTTGLGDDQQAWFVGRGIPISVVNRNKITQSPKGWVEFNYYDGGELVNIKYRSITNKKFMQHKGGKPIFYGLVDMVASLEKVFITEGEMDKLSVEVAGYENCISVPMGAPNENDSNADGKLKCMELHADILNDVERFVIAVDSDRNGRRLQEELARRLGKHRCQYVDFSPLKDANEYLIEHGAEALKELLGNPKDFPIEGVSTVGDHIQKVHDLYVHGIPPAFDTDMGYELGKLYKVAPGFLSIVTGAPTSGKSNFVENIAVNMMKKHGWRFAAFTPEHPEELEIQRMARMYTRKFFFKGESLRMSVSDLAEAVGFLNEHLYFVKHKLSNDIETIIQTFREVVMRYGIKGAIIDPWTDVEHKYSGVNETTYVANSLAKLKDFCRETGVHVWLIAHPAKPRKDKSGHYLAPTMYDISGSANFYNKADFGIIIHRRPPDDEEKYRNKVEVSIKKVKFEGIHGKQGSAWFEYDYPSCTYSQTSNPSNEIDIRF